MQTCKTYNAASRRSCAVTASSCSTAWPRAGQTALPVVQAQPSNGAKVLGGSRGLSGPRAPRPLSIACNAVHHEAPGNPDKPQLPSLSFSKEEVSAVLRMARLHNTLPALALVLVGAWAGTGRSPAIVSNITVWAMGLISAGVSAASMVINDYFDWMSGTDNVNAPDKPLPSGQVKPDMAVLMAGSLYVAVLMAACLMDNPAVRAIVAFSAGATLLYTPVFKRVTMVKNALVASVIALAPLSGALAAGASAVMLQRLAVPSLFAFTGIMYREVLMDCSDEAGDRQAGVITLPVLLGPGPALLLATCMLLVGGIAGIITLLSAHTTVAAASTAATAASAVPSAVTSAAIAVAKAISSLAAAGVAGSAELAGLAALPSVLPVAAPALPNLACACLVGLAVGQIVAQVVSVFRAGFSPEALSRAVDGCMKPMGLAIIMLAGMA